MRTSQPAITMVICKAAAMHAVFLILCFLYVFAVMLSEPYRAVIGKSFFAGLALASPILVFEVVWLSYDSLANALIKESNKLSRCSANQKWPTRRSSGPPPAAAELVN